MVPIKVERYQTPWPEMAVTALWAHRERQADNRATADMTWSERDLVFSTRTGAALDAANVRREFR